LFAERVDAVDQRVVLRRNGTMRNFLLQLAGRAVVLSAIGLVAVGLSGGVAAAFGGVAGASFVAGDPPGATYSGARCAEFHEYVPHATSCEQAATEHHFGEVVLYRVAAGIAGLAAVCACALLRRRRPALFATDRLPRGFDDTVAATAFGLAGVALAAYGADQAVLGHNGAGAWLSGGIVAIIAAAAYSVRFVRRAIAD
jgi:hypothetical protein